MVLKVLGSGSKGNAYLLKDSKKNMLLIECGIAVNLIKKAIEWDLNLLLGCLVTHGHQDHCKSIKDLANHGVDIYASRGTLEETNIIHHHRSHVVKPLKKTKIGPFSILGFKVIHDTKEPFGFVINHNESGVIVFITDSVYSPYKFKNVTHWIVEANYDEETLNERLSNNNAPSFLRNRIIESHFSIQNLEQMLLANDLSSTRTITITHLSDTNSNEKKFKDTIQSKFLKEVTIANKNIEIDLNKYPF